MSLRLQGFEAGIPRPSRSHLGPALAQTFHAGQFSCATGHGVQHRCSGQTDGADTMSSEHNCSLCHQSAASQRAAAPQQVSQVWLLRGTCVVLSQGRWQCRDRDTRARSGVESAAAWHPRAWGTGQLARPHTTFVHFLTVPKPPTPNHRARRKGPTGSSKGSDQASLDAEKRVCKGEIRLPQAQVSNRPSLLTKASCSMGHPVEGQRAHGVGRGTTLYSQLHRTISSYCPVGHSCL